MRVLFCSLLLCSATWAAIQTCTPSPCNPRAISTDFTFIVDVSSALGGQANFLAVTNFLSNFTSGLTLSPEDSQIAIYTYAYSPKRYSTLTQGSDPVAVQNAIQTITFDNTADRQLYQALNKEESEVTANSGFRAGYKHVMVVISADTWTGQSVIGSMALMQAQAKYDLIISLGVGANAVKNQATILPQLSGVQSNVFFAVNYDQLPYAAQWVYNYACPGTHMVTHPPTTTIMPTQSPSLPCQLGSLNYDVYLVVDTSNAITAADFAALKQTLINFVKVFPIDNGQKTQFALVATSIDSELYYTAFHQGQSRAGVLETLQTLTQDGSTGQTLKLSLQAIQGAYLNQNYPTAHKLVVYFSGTTNFDTSPDALMKTLSQTFQAKALAVQWAQGAAVPALSSFTGGANCVLSATSASARASVPTWIQSTMCSASFCL